MGFYWTTYLYQGKIVEIDTNDFNELKEKNIKFIIICKKHILFYNKKIVMSSIDPVLENTEITQGYVSNDEINRWLSVHLDEKQQWNNQLTNNSCNFNIFIAQVGWDTYGDNAYLEYNLPVV